MKSRRIAEIPAMAILCVGIALGQDVARDMDKGADKTGHLVKHAGQKVAHTTKSGVKSAGHGTKIVAKDTAKGVKKAAGKTGGGIKDTTGKQPPSKPS
jgi:hypothetical protein